jgi:hypothetical protein
MAHRSHGVSGWGVEPCHHDGRYDPPATHGSLAATPPSPSPAAAGSFVEEMLVLGSQLLAPPRLDYRLRVAERSARTLSSHDLSASCSPRAWAAAAPCARAALLGLEPDLPTGDWPSIHLPAARHSSHSTVSASAGATTIRVDRDSVIIEGSPTEWRGRSSGEPSAWDAPRTRVDRRRDGATPPPGQPRRNTPCGRDLDADRKRPRQPVDRDGRRPAGAERAFRVAVRRHRRLADLNPHQYRSSRVICNRRRGGHGRLAVTGAWVTLLTTPGVANARLGLDGDVCQVLAAPGAADRTGAVAEKGPSAFAHRS